MLDLLFSFLFLSPPLPFFSLNTFHWGKGIWATWALALFLEARGANDHLYNWHDPVGTSQKLSHVIRVPMDSCHSKGPPRMSWCPLIHLSHVSQRVLEQVFLVSPNKTSKMVFQSMRSEVTLCVQETQKTSFSRAWNHSKQVNWHSHDLSPG